MTTNDFAFILFLAICMDLLLGDREEWPHPVRWMGQAVSGACSAVRVLKIHPFWQGTAATLSLVAATWLTVSILQMAVCSISDILCIIFSSLTIYFGISLKCLAKEAESVISALESQGIDAAAKRLSRIVGRDTAYLDQGGICMAVIETVAENFVDGILAPFFYALVAGPAGCMAYKMINTLDSMIGYKNDKYRFFGKCAARLDDAANWLPARISLICILTASILPWRSITPDNSKLTETVQGILSDRHKHSSPNSGIPEAAFAWCLDVRLGGPAFYEGKKTDYPYINEKGKVPLSEDVHKAVTLLYLSSLLTYSVAIIALLLPMSLT